MDPEVDVGFCLIGAFTKALRESLKTQHPRNESGTMVGGHAWSPIRCMYMCDMWMCHVSTRCNTSTNKNPSFARCNTRTPRTGMLPREVEGPKTGTPHLGYQIGIVVYIPDAPWDCHICLHWGGLRGQWGGSPMAVPWSVWVRSFNLCCFFPTTQDGSPIPTRHAPPIGP